MTSTSRCPRCYTPLRPTESPGGLCPKCLISVAMGEPAVHRSMTGAPLPPPPTAEELAPHFPQLVIGEVIGRGGMGVVYGAVQRDLDRMVALKVLTVDHEADPTFSERFQREARAMASLSHPNIAAVYDSGRAGPWYYLMLELVDGPNLRQVISEGDVSPSNALRIVGEMCVALDFAHSEGVVHRDIKPENVLLDPKGRVKIVDFGLAKLVTPGLGNPTLTRTDQAMGTMHYVAPEQVRRPLEVDHRADIYSMGVVFYELLTGELPMGRFEVPSKLRSTDPRVDPVVLKALENDPERRYQHASDVQLDVDHIRQTPPGRPTRVRGKGRRKQASKVERKSGAFGGFPAVLIGCLALSAVGFMTLVLGNVFLAKAESPDPNLMFTGDGGHTLNDPPPIISSTQANGPGANASEGVSISEGYRRIGHGGGPSDGPAPAFVEGADRLAAAIGRWPLEDEELRENLDLTWQSYRAVELLASSVTYIPWDTDWLRIDIEAFPDELELIREQVVTALGYMTDEEERELREQLAHKGLFPSGEAARTILVDDSGRFWEIEDVTTGRDCRWAATGELAVEFHVVRDLLTIQKRHTVRQAAPRWTAPLFVLGLGDKGLPVATWDAAQQAWNEYRRVEKANTHAILTVGEEDGEVLRTLHMTIDPFQDEVDRIVSDLEEAIHAVMPAEEAMALARKLYVQSLCPFGFKTMHFKVSKVGGMYRCVDLDRLRAEELTGIADPDAMGEVPALSPTVAHWGAYFHDPKMQGKPVTTPAARIPKTTYDGADHLAVLAHRWPIEDPQIRDRLQRAWNIYLAAQVKAARLDPDIDNEVWLRVEMDAFPDELETVRGEVLQAFGSLAPHELQDLERRLRDPEAFSWGDRARTFFVHKKGVTWEVWDSRFQSLSYTPNIAVDTRIALLDGWLTSERVEAACNKPARWNAPFNSFGLWSARAPSELLDLGQALWDDYRALERSHSKVTVQERTAEARESHLDIRNVRLEIAAFAEARSGLIATFTRDLDAMLEPQQRDFILGNLDLDVLCSHGEKAEEYDLIFSPGCLQSWHYDLDAPLDPDGTRPKPKGQIHRPIPVAWRHWLEYGELDEPE